MLTAGQLPLTPAQVACLQQSADGSDAVGQFLALSTLLGMAMLFGEGDETAMLWAQPGMQSLLQTPTRTILANYSAWVDQAHVLCGIPDYEPPGTNISAQGAWCVHWKGLHSEARICCRSARPATRILPLPCLQFPACSFPALSTAACAPIAVAGSPTTCPQ